jgi:DNA-binding CsgD family transcriptional regulator
MTSGAPKLGDPLTRREVDVLALAATGMTNEANAGRLGIDTSTVKTHLRRIFVKIGAANATHAVSLAHRRHILPTPVRGGAKTVEGTPARTRTTPGVGAVAVPADALDLLEACALAVTSGRVNAAARFGEKALEALGPRRSAVAVEPGVAAR